VQLSRRRIIITVLLPWLTAKFLFKPRIGPLRKDRLLDRLAFWRSVVGLIVIMIATYGYQDVLQVSNSTFWKAMETGAYALLLPPLSFLVILIVTRPGRRSQLMPGAGRLLGRTALALAFFFLPFLGPNLFGSEANFRNPDPRAAVVFLLAMLLAIAMIAWYCCFWCCTIYWAVRTGLWTGEIHPLLAPIGTAALVLVINGQELIGGDANGVPYWLWLALNLSGTATSLLLSVLEYRHLRSVGYQFRSGPESVTRSEPVPEPV
jgi:hypothetical protein